MEREVILCGMASVVIRGLTVDDAAAYAALRLEMITHEKYAFMGVPGDDRMTELAEVERYLRKPDSVILGAFEGGALVGGAGIFREERVKRRHRAYLWGVYVAEPKRGRGVARALVSECVNIARGWAGIDVVGLGAASTATVAIAMYESMGFVRWGYEPDCTRVGEERVDEVHMQLSL